MLKNFDELTIVDDYMFCTVMEDTTLCTELLTMLLKNKIGKIIKLVKQKPLENQIASKGVRLDIMLEDERGTFYDVEMQTVNQKNLPERMRYYQCALDNSALNRGDDYNDLPKSFIIFLCTFDYVQRGLAVYTIMPVCMETGDRFDDGTVKMIVNSMAAEKAEGGMREFLSYMNGGAPETAFTKAIDQRVRETKEDEQKRREYMLLRSFEMDARRAGIAEGIQAGIAQGMQQGIAQGIKQGRSEGIQAGIAQGMQAGIAQGMQQGIQSGMVQGAHQKAIETARLMKQEAFDVHLIMKMTGLSQKEIEKL